MLVLNKNAKKNLLLQFVSGLGENCYFDSLGQSKVDGVIFKIFITRWHYIELGNNTNIILSFYVSFWQDSTVFSERKLTGIILCHIKHHR